MAAILSRPQCVNSCGTPWPPKASQLGKEPKNGHNKKIWKNQQTVIKIKSILKVVGYISVANFRPFLLSLLRIRGNPNFYLFYSIVWPMWCMFLKHIFVIKFLTHIKDKCLEHFLWYWPQVNATRPHWWLVNIGYHQATSYCPNQCWPVLCHHMI